MTRSWNWGLGSMLGQVLDGMPPPCKTHHSSRSRPYLRCLTLHFLIVKSSCYNFFMDKSQVSHGSILIWRSVCCWNPLKNLCPGNHAEAHDDTVARLGSDGEEEREATEAKPRKKGRFSHPIIGGFHRKLFGKSRGKWGFIIFHEV